MSRERDVNKNEFLDGLYQELYNLIKSNHHTIFSKLTNYDEWFSYHTVHTKEFGKIIFRVQFEAALKNFETNASIIKVTPSYEVAADHLFEITFFWNII